jgi:hypothetical protein
MAKYVSAVIPQRLTPGATLNLTGIVSPANLRALELSRDGWGVVCHEPIQRSDGYLATFIGCAKPPEQPQAAAPEPVADDPLLCEIRTLIAALRETNALLRALALPGVAPGPL